MISNKRQSHSAAKRKFSGFTLIELLVVVAIIALLISILLPSLNGARRSAKQVLCSTNLRAQGEAAAYYRDDNREYGIRGIERFNTPGITEYHIYHTSILKYLGQYDGKTLGLWRPGILMNPELPGALSGTKQFLCPDNPNLPSSPTEKQIVGYVASAFPISYPQESIDWDVSGGGYAGDSYQGVGGDSGVAYRATYQMKEFEGSASPARIIFVTEAHASLNNWNELRFFHFFLTSQLPLAQFPRIASDQRHPGGINALFFDGHVQAMRQTYMDAGYPNSLGMRLKWFTVAPPAYQ